MRVSEELRSGAEFRASLDSLPQSLPTYLFLNTIKLNIISHFYVSLD